MDLTSNETQIAEAVKALRKCVDDKENAKQTLKNIFDEESATSRTGVYIIVTLFKIPKIPKDGTTMPLHLKIPIANSFVDESTDILLITKDISKHKGLRKDHEPSLHFYKDFLGQHNALDMITEVMPLKQLRVEYREYESKRALFSRFDMVLAEKAILNRLGLFLGREFYKRKKIPIGVDLGKKGKKYSDIRSVLDKVLSKVYLHFELKGTCSMGQVGRLDQSDKELSENLKTCFTFFENRIPGKWINIHSIHIKTRNSNSVPIYVSLKSANEVPECVHPNAKKAPKPVVDMVDTPYGEKKVSVFPDGTVHVEGLNDWEKKQLDKDHELNEEKKMVDAEKKGTLEKIWKKKSLTCNVKKKVKGTKGKSKDKHVGKKFRRVKK